MSLDQLALSRYLLAAALAVQIVASVVWLRDALAAVALMTAAIACVGVIARGREGDWLRWAISADVALGFSLVASRFFQGASSPTPWLVAITTSIALGCVAFALAQRGRER